MTDSEKERFLREHLGENINTSGKGGEEKEEKEGKEETQEQRWIEKLIFF